MKIPICNHLLGKSIPKKYEIFFFFFFFSCKDEYSFVSLRDVERAMQVMVWFYKQVDTLGRLMRKVTDADDEEVVMKPFDIFYPTK